MTLARLESGLPLDMHQVDIAQIIREAAQRIRPYIHRTPLLSSRSLSERIGVEVRLKCENMQRAGRDLISRYFTEIIGDGVKTPYY
jgi:signal transduction histidine kinase